MESLEKWLAHTAAPDISLDRLESGVWTRVRALETERTTSRLRLAAVAFALTVGLANGGLGASLAPPPTSEIALFTSASLSPLARLEAG